LTVSYEHGTYPQSACPRLLCVLDGNERDTDLPGQLRHPVEFLPGDLAPEQFLRDSCNGHQEELGRALRISTEEVVIALAAAEGVNHHQWLFDLMNAFNVTYERIVSALVHVALADAATRESCQQFVDMIANQLAEDGVSQPT